MKIQEIIKEAKEESLIYEFVNDYISRLKSIDTNYNDYKLCTYMSIMKDKKYIKFFITDNNLTIGKHILIKDFQKYLRKKKLERILKK